MPHIKRAPIEYTPLPASEALDDPDYPVFYIDYTGEIFLTYDEYSTRVNLYRRKIWACEFTGKINLTFSEALESERRAKIKVEERFPRVWNQPALECIHFNQIALNELIDELYELFKATYFVGETVYVSITPDPTLSERATLISDVVDTHHASADTTTAVDTTDKLYRSKYKDPKTGAIPDVVDIVPGEKAYYLLVASDPPKTAVLSISHLRRDRLALSKQTFKKYIREVSSKDKWIGAPWYVRPELVQKYGLRTTPPDELQQILDKRNYKAVVNVAEKVKPEVKKKPPKEEVISYPIDDLELYRRPLLRQSPEEGKPLGLRPVPSQDFGAVPNTHILRLITVWNFVTVYGPVLHIYPFTFDDLVQALSSTCTSQIPPLLEELFSSLILLVCDEWARGIDTNTGVHPEFEALPDPPALPTDGTVLEGKDMLMAQSINAYLALTADERVAIDQWFKWHPSGWTTPIPHKRRRTLPSRTSHVSQYSSTAPKPTDRLKAWEVALAGIIKDCVHPDSENDMLKWRVLSLLLTSKTAIPLSTPSTADAFEGNEGSTSISDSADFLPAGQSHTTKDASHQLDIMNNTAEMEDVSKFPDVTADTTVDTSVNGTLEDTAEYQDQDLSVSNDVNDDEDDDEEGGGDYMENGSGRSSGASAARKHRKILDSDEDDWTPASRSSTSQSRKALRQGRKGKSARLSEGSSPTRLAASASARQSRVSGTMVSDSAGVVSSPMSEAVETVSGNGIAKKPKKKRRPKSTGSGETDTMLFDDLCRASRSGFIHLSAADRVEVLAYIIDVCLVDCEILRQCRDKAIDEGIELRKERRDIIRDRKAVAQSLLETDFSTEEIALTTIVEPDLKSEIVDDLGSEQSCSDSEKASRQLSRVEKLRAEQLKRESEEKRRQEELQRQKEQFKGLKVRQEGRRKLEEKDRQLNRRQRVIDHLLRIKYAMVRVKPLGRDRFYNRYWWFDGGFGAYPFSAVTQGLEGKGSTPDVEAGVLEYASGFLFVEEFGVDKMVDEKWIQQWNETLSESEDLKQPRVSECGAVLDSRLGLLNGDWGYYSTPEQIHQLLSWLDTRGIRELHLSGNIMHLEDFIIEGMNKRSEMLASAISKEVNGSSRYSKADYENIWAQE
ncbi:hypothetical protein BASA81_009925 [Batrachochytrium salamandrivorans]|nr:hypothetical protein BASA81_009925 [Batrachochytrium salamandrivorans]